MRVACGAVSAGSPYFLCVLCQENRFIQVRQIFSKKRLILLRKNRMLIE